MRWEQAVSAFGSMYRRFFYLLEPGNRPGLSEMMDERGVEHSGEVLENNDFRRDLHGCTLALMFYHRILGIKSSIAEESETRSLSTPPIACGKTRGAGRPISAPR